MRKFSLSYIFPLYVAIILLDLNEFVTRFLGSEGVLTVLIFVTSIFLIVSTKPYVGVTDALNNLFLLAFLGFIFLGAFATILESNLEVLEVNLRYYIPSLLIYFSIYRTVMGIRIETEFYRIISIAAILIGINAILILISILLNIDFHGATGVDQVERAVGLYSNANRAGYVSAIGQSLALLLLFSRKVKRRNFYFGLYILCLIATFTTFSKGSILLSMLLLVRILYLGLSGRGLGRNRGLFKRYLRVFSFLMFFLVAGGALGVVNFQSRLSSLQTERIEQLQLLLQGQINQETTTQRSELAKLAFDKMQNTFFLGAGLGKFRRMDIGVGSHNIYLLILGEAGVLALILYLAFLLFWAKKSFTYRRFDSIRFASGNILLIFFFSGFASHTLLANKPYILTLALIFASLELNNRGRLA